MWGRVRRLCCPFFMFTYKHFHHSFPPFTHFVVLVINLYNSELESNVFSPFSICRLYLYRQKETTWTTFTDLICFVFIYSKLVFAVKQCVLVFQNKVSKLCVLKSQDSKACVFTILVLSSLLKTSSRKGNHLPERWNWECPPWQKTC